MKVNHCLPGELAMISCKAFFSLKYTIKSSLILFRFAMEVDGEIYLSEVREKVIIVLRGIRKANHCLTWYEKSQKR